MFKLILVTALLPAMALGSVHFSSCLGAPSPVKLTVNDCSGSDCRLRTYMPAHIVASGMVSRVSSTTVMARMTIRVNGWQVVFDLLPEVTDACRSGIFGGCPIIAGKPFSYALIFDHFYAPATNGSPNQFEISLIGDGGAILACVSFYAHVEQIAVDPIMPDLSIE